MNNQAIKRLLLIEDSEGDARLIREMLNEPGSHNVELNHVECMAEAEEHLKIYTPDIILCDLGLPDAQGLDALHRAQAAAPRIPVVVLTVLDSDPLVTQSLQAGAQDYLIKGQIDTRSLLRALRYARERKNSQEALRESETRFREMAENIREVFWLTDPSKNEMLYVSPAYEDIWGRSAQGLYSSRGDWVEAIHPDDRYRVIEAQTKQAAGDYDEEYRITRPDGSIRWIRDRAFPVLDERRNVTRVAGVAEDITERRRTSDALYESERRFRDLLGNVELVSLMLDRDGRLTYCNDFLLRVTGWTRDEVMGKDWFSLFLPAPHDELRKINTALMRGALAARHHENEILTRSGTRRLIRWSNSVLRSPAGDVIGTASIGEDITEQKLAERKIKGLNRVYAVLSGINTLLVRVRNRNELFREACKVAVDHGRFVMAWIGTVDLDAGIVQPVASAGDVGDFFATAALTLNDALPGGLGLVGQVIAAMEPVVSNDATNDPRLLMKRELPLRRIGSVAVLPLTVGKKSVGVLALYAADSGFFDDEEMKLLVELAGNISIGLEHIQQSEKLDYLAYYDPLTGLANRTLFLERVGQLLIAAGDAKRKITVFVLDVERFSTVNEALGRQAGDALLKHIGERMLKAGRGEFDFPRVAGDRFAALREGSHLARVGGDHFAVVSTEPQSEQQVTQLAEFKLKKYFDIPFRFGESEMRVSAKIGIAIFPNDGADAETLLTNATAAVWEAKAGSEQYVFYKTEMSNRTTATLTMENMLRRALENEEFVLHYQPKVEFASQRIVGVEALIRWQSPLLGLVPPMKFIPLMEETGLILPVGAWALSQAVTDHARWAAIHPRAPRVAVNVSAVQLQKRDFVKTIGNAIAHGTTPTGLELELTESLLMQDIAGNIEKLKEIRVFGVSIAIDDFGTGYSSLAYLAKLPVQTLKIDRSFVTTMLNDPHTMTLVRTIISLAHALRLTVVAEGVDSEDQAKMLRLLGCDEMQGHLFSKAVPFEGLMALLEKRDTVTPRPGPHRVLMT
jgi:PAS domain S-box-containing protein